jgi:hypothetical protein
VNNHRSLRELISGHRDEGREPTFEPSEDHVLVSFAELFATSELVAFDANKQLRSDALSPLYDCQTESVPVEGAPADVFAVVWTPVWEGTDPLAGFRTGHDSAFLGTTLTVAMPPDERTDALLLLVTSAFTHLSGRWEQGAAVVQGAIDADGGYRFVQLSPARTSALSRGPAASEPAVLSALPAPPPGQESLS